MLDDYWKPEVIHLVGPCLDEVRDVARAVCRNYEHVIKVSELSRRVSSQLMRSCHMVFIEMRWGPS